MASLQRCKNSTTRKVSDNDGRYQIVTAQDAFNAQCRFPATANTQRAPCRRPARPAARTPRFVFLRSNKADAAYWLPLRLSRLVTTGSRQRLVFEAASGVLGASAIQRTKYAAKLHTFGSLYLRCIRPCRRRMLRRAACRPSNRAACSNVFGSAMIHHHHVQHIVVIPLHAPRYAASGPSACCSEQTAFSPTASSALTHHCSCRSRRRDPRQREQDIPRNSLSGPPHLDIGNAACWGLALHHYQVRSRPVAVFGCPHRNLAGCGADKFLVQLHGHARRP